MGDIGSIAVISLIALLASVYGGRHELRLLQKFENQLAGFNKYERPVLHDNDHLKVELGLTLQQIIDVDEKNQIIYTNMWITMRWSDYKLRWDPDEFGNITELTIPQDLVWKPDILMYNRMIGHDRQSLLNVTLCLAAPQHQPISTDAATSLQLAINTPNAADSFDASYQSRVIVRHNGALEQIPPGMFKSTCHINIRWFPFDDQECAIKFGSWTYDGTKIDLRFLDGVAEGSTDGFQKNGEWDLIGFPADRNVIRYDCCPDNPFIDLTYKVQIRRRKLYYLVNIVAPCMLFAFLGLFTFVLPPDAGEKISFSVTVLLSLTVFMMIVSDTLPATSEAIPLIAIYFMGIMVMTAGSVISTIISLSMHHRTSETHEMPRFVKVGINEWLAWILRMKRPGHDPPVKKDSKASWKDHKEHTDFKMLNLNVSKSLIGKEGDRDHHEHYYTSFAASSPNIPVLDVPSHQTLKLDTQALAAASNHVGSYGKDSISGPNLARFELRAILKELRFMTTKMKEDEDSESVSSDWKWCAMVLDRLFIWIVGILNIIVAACVLLTAPNLFKAESS